MQSIKLPYGKSQVELNIPNERLNAVLVSNIEGYKPTGTEESIVRNSLENPIGSKRLSILSKDVKKVLLITSDHTRPVPSKVTIPLLLEEIRKFNPLVEVKILIATGCHRPSTKEEVISKFGIEIVNREELVMHISRDYPNMVYKGVLPSGGELWLNSLVDWADLVVSEGFIEPHFFAGFSGGRKSILPGIASLKTVLANHCSDFIADPNSRSGILVGNKVHKDMIFAAQVAKLEFILNVVLNEKKEVINAFSGDSEKAHIEGCAFVSSLSRVRAVYSEIVIATNGGYPLDQNIYQAVKGMTTAAATVKDKGVIIMVAQCEDGHGGEEFCNWFKGVSSVQELVRKIEGIPQSETIEDQWEAQMLSNILLKYEVILVSDKCDPELIKSMFMHHAMTVSEALEMAYKVTSCDAKITVIPDGVSIIVE